MTRTLNEISPSSTVCVTHAFFPNRRQQAVPSCFAPSCASRPQPSFEPLYDGCAQNNRCGGGIIFYALHRSRLGMRSCSCSCKSSKLSTAPKLEMRAARGFASMRVIFNAQRKRVPFAKEISCGQLCSEALWCHICTVFHCHPRPRAHVCWTS